MPKKAGFAAEETVVTEEIDAVPSRRSFSALSINVRLDDELRRRVREVMSRHHINVSQAVRMMMNAGSDTLNKMDVDLVRAGFTEAMMLTLGSVRRHMLAIVEGVGREVDEMMRDRKNR